MIIAGEASGDLHGSRLVTAMLERDPSIYFIGIGGEALREAGVRIVVEASTLAVVGITEVLSKGRSLLKGISKAAEVIKLFNPDLIILIDFPDFNLHMAAKAKKLDIPVLYYVSPQIWAWRQGRIKKIKERVDHMAVILPFEESFYKEHGISATFVGHPLLDDRKLNHEAEEVDVNNEETAIGLLPGSRDKEVSRHLPVMLAAADCLQMQMKNVRFIVSHAPTVDESLLGSILKKHRTVSNLVVTGEHVGRIFQKSRLVVAVSGTVTLEAALSRTPTIIIYKVSPLSYWIGKALIQVKHIGLVNLIAEKSVVPELIQKEVTPENIADHVMNMINSPKRMEETISELVLAQNRLGEPGASDRVADIAFNLMNSRIANS
jgi:lipid-A-disaccharide synthase